MRNVLAGLVIGGMLMGAAAPVHAIDPAEEALLGLGAMVANTGYIPAKLLVAGVGMIAGGLVGVSTGDERSSYGVMTPLIGGTYALRASHFTGQTPIEFFGSDYADTPSQRDRENEGSKVYDAAYGVRK